ncbi:MAG: M1 family metallopeptidase, partial [Candidatus Baltobacteraceae bacterium]
MKSFPLPGAQPQYGPDKLVVVEHIDLHLRPDLGAQRLDGVCTTTVRAIGEGVHELTLDAVDFTIGSVRDGEGKPLHFHRATGTLAVQLARALAAGERTTFAVAYRVERPRAGLFFIAPTAEHPEKPTQCWTQSQDQYARYWLPCFDHPHAKQTTSTTIVVPTGTFALGNGRLVERSDDAESGYTTFGYEQDVAHPTYLLTLVAGTFVEVEQPGTRVPVYYYVVPGREADGERSFAKTPRMIDVFEERIGTPYPFARYSQIAVADFIFGGMENTAATTQTDRTLHDERAHLDFSSDSLVAHELAHQWFGDLLTTRDWSHAWLNEGFATFFEGVFREADLGLDEYLLDVSDWLDDYVQEYEERYARPIVENRYRDPVELFDRHLYQRGGLVLHALRCELGEGAFWASIRYYVAKHAGGSVETIDLVRAVEAATGRNVRAFIDQWVLRAGHAQLNVEVRYDRELNQLVVRVKQMQTIDDANPAYRLALEIGLAATGPAVPAQNAGGAPLPGERRVRAIVEGGDQTFAFACEHEPALVRVDPGAATVGTLALEADATLLASMLRSEPSPPARIRAAVALAKDASPAAFDALAAALENDPFWGVRAGVAKALGSTHAERGRALLWAALADPHPKVRRAVAQALGAFHDPATAERLTKVARSDASYFVVAAALEALGKTRAGTAFATLTDALKRPSWQSTIAVGAVRGLAELGERRAVEAIVGVLDPRNDDALHGAALAALARAAEVSERGRDLAVEQIVTALDARDFETLHRAVIAAGKAGDSRALPALERLETDAFDGRLRRRA